MSYKIFNAYKVPADLSIGRINEVIQNIKEVLKPHIESHLRRAILSKATTLYFSSLKDSFNKERKGALNGENWKEEVGQTIGISELVYSRLILDPEFNSHGYIDPENCIKFITSNLFFLINDSNESDYKKDNPLTSEVTIDFFSYKNSTYFRIFTPLSGDLQEYLGNAYKSYDYKYFDYCDKPSEYTAKDWGERATAWSAIYSGDQCNKLTVTIFDAPSISKPEKILGNPTSFKEEAIYIYKAKRDIFVFSYYIDKKISEAKSNYLSEVVIGNNTYHINGFKNASTYFDVISDLNIYKKKEPKKFDEYVQEYSNRIIDEEEFFERMISVKK